nr:replication initiator [Virgisporangium aliadipatigenens]
MWGTGSNAEQHRHAPASSAIGTALTRAGTAGYFDWLHHVQAAAGCTRPIRLVGTLETTHPRTGQRLILRDTLGMPDAAIYKACGNRRARVCPSCARTYQRDAYQLLRAGLVGGKGVSDTVSQHPAVFATFTAPSFGPVHARVVSKHTCADRRRCDCRAEPCRARRNPTGLCAHGRPAVCWVRHEAGDTAIGRPLCLDCYDYDHHAVWNHHAGELWRCTKQTADRHLARLAAQRGIPRVIVGYDTKGRPRTKPAVQLRHGKVAEFQTRGAVHFHVLLRLDGRDGSDPDAVVPPPAGFTTDDIEAAIRHAVAHERFDTPPHLDRLTGWPIAWGDPDKGLDIRHIALSGHRTVTDSMVAGYLAKYATKSTEVTGHTPTRITTDNVDEHADPDGDHTARLIHACWRLGRPFAHKAALLHSRAARAPEPGERRQPFDTPWNCPDCGTRTRYTACPSCVAERQANLDTQPANNRQPGPYEGLRRWAHMLGFGGHFLTKARRYSVTFGLLRDTRIAYRREHDHQADTNPGTVRAAEHTTEETTLVVGVFTFAGAGWRTTGDALLANTAADLARSRRAAGREELAHEAGAEMVERMAA